MVNMAKATVDSSKVKEVVYLTHLAGAGRCTDAD
jgi:hypothetical protein